MTPTMSRDDVITLATFDEAYQRYFAAIERYIQRFVAHRDLASDLAQETFTKAWKGLRPGQSVSPAWLYRIAHNCAIEVLRRRRIITQLPFSLLGQNLAGGEVDFPDETATAQFMEAIADRDALRDVFSQLAPGERECLAIALEETTCWEGAQQLGISTAAYKMRLGRARVHFKELWQQEVAA